MKVSTAPRDAGCWASLLQRWLSTTEMRQLVTIWAYCARNLIEVSRGLRALGHHGEIEAMSGDGEDAGEDESDQVRLAAGAGPGIDFL